MFALTMNSGDGESLNTTFYGLFDTHKEAHDEMVALIGRHRADWIDACGVDEDDISERVNEDTAQLVEGDAYDWVYYEKYFIFDTDECRTFGY